MRGASSQIPEARGRKGKYRSGRQIQLMSLPESLLLHFLVAGGTLPRIEASCIQPPPYLRAD